MAADDWAISVTVQRRVNLGNYESQEFTISVRNVPFEATEEELERAMKLADDTYSKIQKRLRAKVALIRKEHADLHPFANRA